MFEFYTQIKATHVGLVSISVGLFVLRTLSNFAGMRLAMAAPVRYLSYGIDTALLTSALMLLTILPGAMFANHWLTVKMGLLLIYVVLGSYALKRGRTPAVRIACFVVALAVIVMMVGIARQHSPLGWLSSPLAGRICPERLI